MFDPEKPPQPAGTAHDWTQYIGAVNTYDALTVDTERLWRDLDAISQHLFGNKTEVWVSEEQYDSNSNTTEAPAATYSNPDCAQELEHTHREPCRVLKTCDDVAAVFEGDKPSHRIVSLIRLHPKAEFRINLPSLLKILRRHEICPSFFDLFMSFRTTSAPAEKGDGAWSMRMHSSLTQVISYQLRYMEQKPGDSGGIWNDWQIGVYQRLDLNSPAHGITTVLHANDYCKVLRVLHGHCPNRRLPFVKDRPFSVHSLVFSSYLYNWRWYLDSVAQDCRKYENIYMTIELDAVAKRLNFTDLRRVRNLESQLITVKSVLETTTQTLQALIETVTAYRRLQRDGRIAIGPDAEMDQLILSELEQRCRSFLASATEIYKRNEKLVEVMTDSVNISKQTTAERINQTVRVVTIITLTYLPAQFVATFFGTNFVLYNPNSGNIQVSRTVWIFFVCTLCLSLTTGIAWWIARTRSMRHYRGRNQTAC